MYNDAFEEDDLVAEVELVAQARYSRNADLEDGFNDEVVVSQQPATVQIPDGVRNFILFFYRNVLENNVYELHNVYDTSFNKLTDKYYTKQSWPEAEIIARLVNNDEVFLTLYRELYYRHIYGRLTPTLEHRFRSYENYCDLFNYILNSEGPVNLELPNQWLWDIIDEFIYQFQSFSNYRDRLKSKSEEEIALLRDNPQIWSTYSVLNVLYSFIQKSRINEQLLVSKKGGDMMEAAGEYGARPLYKNLGYFSIIGLLRVNCLMGDFVLALKMMDNVVLNKKALFARVTACHVTAYYYVGFAYMMMRRYADAIKAFSNVLSFLQRTKPYHSRSYQSEQLARKSDQMYALLAMCIALCPTRLDENIHSQLREKFGEHISKMQKGEEGIPIFEELFQYACPKFISASGRLDGTPRADPYTIYMKTFVTDIRNQIKLPTLRSFMKLYTTMGVDKLAKFLEMDPEELKMQLLVFKQKSRQIKWVSGDLLDGEYLPTSDLDFCLKQDVVHIAESKVGRRYADWFLRNINRCEDIVASLEQRA
ncbi:RNA polymerase I-associated factor PAF67-domain-containing protein [Phascolomyces articulosus]|uniref:Eukaryotic translation initiation factor 3 subunit L n=1 Tax=Phascolomyces articulosus TaxID=60185 RepID=A0AAD5KFW6_9FUNG|nr:RNA polymerase I-associated factor PAF67-domain-containing protein [Phascolomyces articulosus]